MSDWTNGYCAALGDIQRLVEDRGRTLPTRFRKMVSGLLADLVADASIIEHEALNRKQRIALHAANVAERDAASGRAVRSSGRHQ